MITVENKCGRLLEVSIGQDISQQDVGEMVQAVRLHALATKGTFVLVATLDRTSAFAPEANEPLLQMLVRDNPKIARSGYLLRARYGSLALQVDRLVRSAGNPNRRWFYDAGELAAWLREALDVTERQRLSVFLGQVAPRA